ncbi:pyridoxal phosphate-dependent aminotransferase [Derxia gummosa]|uniref:Pyridoxal phosphate-dependent aminotransferase n=1 Tax=Derxia gummosa DSM 723 TaxID=1121388 RepID=A0A8B6X1L1_9BURK|nr:pyridoxal phosphate-dependent aminotransferase [Derxia gummosa]
MPETAATPRLVSRLPRVGTTIFTTMSALATEHGAINLGQGFPDFDCDPALIECVERAMRANLNQYPPMAGLPALREAVAGKIARMHGRRYDPAGEITITAGGTQAILTAILAVVHPGDEVVVIEPVYDSYLPNIALAGGVAVRVPLRRADVGGRPSAPEAGAAADDAPAIDAPAAPAGATGFAIDWDALAAAITPRTRLVLINSPHNPTGASLDDADLDRLAALVRGTDILLLGDEVYEHMVFDGREHQSLARHDELAARSFVVSSFGKTFHVTGWKVGYCAAPPALTAEFRKVHQFNVFTVNTPMQAGLADYLRDPAPWRDLAGFYQRKRDRFRAGLAGSGFRLLPCSGTYFQCAEYAGVTAAPSGLSELDFCRWLTTEVGVAAIPLSSFYDEPTENGIVRFCFAKRDDTLDEAIRRLAAL